MLLHISKLHSHFHHKDSGNLSKSDVFKFAMHFVFSGVNKGVYSSVQPLLLLTLFLVFLTVWLCGILRKDGLLLIASSISRHPYFSMAEEIFLSTDLYPHIHLSHREMWSTRGKRDKPMSNSWHGNEFWFYSISSWMAALFAGRTAARRMVIMCLSLAKRQWL